MLLLPGEELLPGARSNINVTPRAIVRGGVTFKLLPVARSNMNVTPRAMAWGGVTFKLLLAREE